MPARPTCLFLTQTLPARHGFGSALRVGQWIEALAQTHAVTLAVMSTDPSVTEAALEPGWRELCAEVCVRNFSAHAVGFGMASLSRFASPGPRLMTGWPISVILGSLAGWRGATFDLALVSRLRLMPVWQALVSGNIVRATRTVLDLDDIESTAHERITRVHGPERLGVPGFAREIGECRKLAQAETAAHASFDRVAVCSTLDRHTLEDRFGRGKVRVVPNAVRPPDTLAPSAPAGSSPHLLFVGSLDYVPNADAVGWLAREILPAIAARGIAPLPGLKVVGRRPVEWMRQLAANRAFELFADVPDVAPYYAGACAALVPIRAGGGTRIKILEAMAHGVPVVSTRLGAEGIEAVDGENILLADDAAGFAATVERLQRDAGLAAFLVRNARRFVEQGHSSAAFAASVAGLVG